MEASPEPYPSRTFRWEVLVPLLVHPVKVAIIEAMTWIDRPLSATDLDRILQGELGVSLLSYHLRKLAELEIIAPAHRETVRGATQTFYAFSGNTSPNGNSSS
jgi:hypothetical protein